MELEKDNKKLMKNLFLLMIAIKIIFRVMHIAMLLLEFFDTYPSGKYQRHIRNPVEHLRWSFFTEMIND